LSKALNTATAIVRGTHSLCSLGSCAFCGKQWEPCFLTPRLAHRRCFLN